MSSLEPMEASTWSALRPVMPKRRSSQSTAAWRSATGPRTVG